MKNAFARLLAILLLLHPFVSGCTVTGYSVGKKKDFREAQPVHVSDLTTLNKNDIIQVEVCDGGIYRGRFLKLEKGESLTMDVRKNVRPPLPESDFLPPVRHRGEYEIAWIDLIDVGSVEVGTSNRLEMMGTGFFLDSALIALVYVAVVLMHS